MRKIKNKNKYSPGSLTQHIYKHDLARFKQGILVATHLFWFIHTFPFNCLSLFRFLALFLLKFTTKICPSLTLGRSFQLLLSPIVSLCSMFAAVKRKFKSAKRRIQQDIAQKYGSAEETRDEDVSHSFHINVLTHRITLSCKV